MPVFSVRFWFGVWLVVASVGCPQVGLAQRAKVVVSVTDEDRDPLNGAVVSIVQARPDTDSLKPFKLDRPTDALGRAYLDVPPGDATLRVTAIGFEDYTEEITVSGADRNRFTVRLAILSTDTLEINTDERTSLQDIRNPFMEPLSIRTEEIRFVPSPVQSIESVVSNLAGGTTNEFTSQYRIRGGNFDENLIYLNGVEVYRPQLVRAGWQEGLPVTNSYLVDDASYSAGGFSARYGDKMSSVLEATYRTPGRFRGQAELGLLTQNITLEGRIQKRDSADNFIPNAGRFTWLVGARRYALDYLLNNLDTDGEYNPLAWDVQTVLGYRPRTPDAQYYQEAQDSGEVVKKALVPWDITAFHIVSGNDFRFTPQSRTTNFGTFQQAFQLFVAFIGEEQYRYLTQQAAFVVTHRPNRRTELQVQASAYRSDEDELADVEGGYRIGDLNTNLGNEGFGEVTFVRGVGTELRRSRNFLTAEVQAVALRGRWYLDRNFYQNPTSNFVRHTLYAGVRLQRESIKDQLKEWLAVDSAEFIEQTDFIESDNAIESIRSTGYLTYQWRPGRITSLNLGVRGSYWDYTQELVVSPRVQFVLDPSQRWKEKQYQFRVAAGLYYQPPFYRELRDLDGTLNANQESQRALHVVLGNDYVFDIGRRPFKLTTEVYYKDFAQLVPYEFQNVRLRYYAFEEATGYAMGLDTRLNGQFIRGVDSYFRVSVLQTEEDVVSTEAGNVRRPSDQRVTTSLFFQDHLPGMPTFKAHINLVYGTGLPFGPPTDLEQRTAFEQPSYQRVDLGLSYLLTLRSVDERRKDVSLRSVWLAAEIFNLFGRQNTVSYTWLNDLFGNQFAIPNYLTGRLLNVRVIVSF